MDPFLAEITLFAGNFAPRGWAFCSGQLLPINQNQALFSLLGTTYGGDGRTTFALPDLRGRVPIQQGNGAGLSHYSLGQRGGKELEQLTLANLPSHNHSVKIPVAEEGDEASPVGNYLAGDPNGATSYKATPDTNEFLATSNSLNNGGSQAFDIRQPFLGLNYIIATQGVFPSRN